MEEFDLVVIGSGPGGYVAAIRAAQLGLKTACVEKGPLGGTCLNVGCIPSKALLRSSELYEQTLSHLDNHGINASNISYSLAKMMGRKEGIINTFRLGVKGLFQKNKVTHIAGKASFQDPHTLQVEGTGPIKAKYFLIATGSEPISLPFLPLDEKKIVSSTGALSLPQVPKKLVVIGAGVIGVELGSVYRRLGSEVIFLEFMEAVCPTFDPAISKAFEQILTKQKLRFELGAKVIKASIQDQVVLTYEKAGSSVEIAADVVLVAVGRRAYTQNLNLPAAGLELNPRGQITVGADFRTHVPHIFAIGDVIDGPMLAHKASEEGIAAVEIIAGKNPHPVDYALIPSVVYTEPEVAFVGLTEPQAVSLGLEVKTATVSMKTNSRAKCSSEEEGLIKVIADRHTDRLLGMHIIGARASEYITIGTAALAKRMKADELGALCFPHPTLAEALKEACLALNKRAIHY